MTQRRSWILDIRICWVVLFCFSILALIPANGQAGLVESRLSTGEASSLRAQDIDKIRQALETEVVSQRLADYGLTPAEVEAKLPTLSDEQIHQLAGLSDNLGEGGVLGVIIALLVIALLVILILKVSDKQVIIK